MRVDGAAPGTPVRLRLRRHAFHFGVNATGTANRFLIEGAPPDSEAGRWQRFVLDRFNTVVPSNAGKWVYNEAVRDFVTMEYPDLMLRWAARHGLYARMHTLLWDTEQQPDWVPDLLGRAAAGDVDARADLVRAIHAADRLLRARSRRRLPGARRHQREPAPPGATSTCWGPRTSPTSSTSVAAAARGRAAA